jgi:hypothetical protein
MPKSRRQQATLTFPVRGLHEAASFSTQPPGTFAAGVNVCGYEPKTGRNRGGSRPGTSKFCPQRIEGMNPIQEVTHVVGLADPGVLLLEDDTGAILLEDGTAIDLGGFQAGNTGELHNTVIAVAQGYVSKVTSTASERVPTGQTTAPLDGSAYTVFSSQFEFGLYFVDGTNYRYYDLALDEIVDWEATVAAGLTPASDSGGVQAGLTAAGTMPRENGKAASLMCVWHGRIVLAIGTNWYMSALGNPFDWEYFPAVADLVTRATSGDTADAGKSGDWLTALIPFSDDVLIIGGQTSIERMSGDPADGGRRDEITHITGIARGRAWCQSPEGIIYFFGSRGGVYRLSPGGGIPQRLTAETIDQRLSNLDVDANVFRLVWNDRRQGVEVFITPKDATATTHYFWCVRNQAWYAVEYSDVSHNPMTLHLLGGYSESERAILIGSFDGYVRKLDINAVDDDGEPIVTYVYLGPFQNTTLCEMSATFGKDSGNVRWSLHQANSAEEALTAEPEDVGYFSAGQNFSEWPRRYFNDGYIQLSSSEPWQFDNMILTLEPGSDNRRRINAH